MNKCKCKCGEKVNKVWVKGHHRKGVSFLLSLETKKKMSNSKLGSKNPMYGKKGSMAGKKHKETTLVKLRNARAKQIFSTEDKEKARIGTITGWKKSIFYKGGKDTQKARSLISQQNRQAKKRQNGGTYTLQDWDKLLKTFNYMCLCCKRCEPEIKLTVDHIVPVSKGGKNEITNLQPLCKSCNSKKHTKNTNYIAEFYKNVKQSIKMV